MDEFLVIGVLALLAVPVTLVALVVGHVRLRRRLSEVESEISVLRYDLQLLHEGVPVGPQASTSLPDAPTEAPPAARPPASAIVTPPPLTRSDAPAPRPPSPVAQALADLGPWLQQNWFYAVSAASLALAGIFLVQYGMENGLLPPRARVAAALAFGAGLIGLGEFIRRRFGDGTQSATAYLPSVFSGAGIVTLFGAILSARLLYDLIGGGAAMGGMAVVALIAVVLGWMHGPLLVAVGVIGAYAAPVVLDSASADASPLFAYFAIVAALGLGVDAVRRWGWISVLTLVLAYLAGFGVLLGGGGAVAWTGQLYFAVLPLLAVLIPARGLVPDHAGQPALLGLLGRLTLGAKERGVAAPGFATLLAFTAVAASSGILLMTWKPGAQEIWLSVALLGILGAALISWSERAPALQDAALLPPLALLLSVAAQGENRQATYTDFANTYAQGPDAAFPWAVTILLGIGCVISVLALWRALRGGQFGVIWAAVAAVYVPVMAILMELTWQPAAVIGSYPWALHAAGLAALMVVFAERLARRDGAARLRVSFAVMSALACMAFAFVIVLSSVALTIALAVTVLAAAALDRLWNLPHLGWFIAVGVVTLGYRLVIDPGLDFAQDGPLPEVLLAYLGTWGSFLAALWLLRPLTRPMAQVMLEFRGLGHRGSDGQHPAAALDRGAGRRGCRRNALEPWPERRDLGGSVACTDAADARARDGPARPGTLGAGGGVRARRCRGAIGRAHGRKPLADRGRDASRVRPCASQHAGCGLPDARADPGVWRVAAGHAGCASASAAGAGCLGRRARGLLALCRDPAFLAGRWRDAPLLWHLAAGAVQLHHRAAARRRGALLPVARTAHCGAAPRGAGGDRACGCQGIPRGCERSRRPHAGVLAAGAGAVARGTCLAQPLGAGARPRRGDEPAAAAARASPRLRAKTGLPPLGQVPISHAKMTGFVIIPRITSPALSLR